jgi:hypothetical protein
LGSGRHVPWVQLGVLVLVSLLVAFIRALTPD